MAIILLLILFGVALIQLLFRSLKNWQPKHKEKPPKRQNKFDLLDFDEFADIMDEDDERGQK